jgi:hypothetical protein
MARLSFLAVAAILAWTGISSADAPPDPRVDAWRHEWPKTDFARRAVDLREIRDVIRRDGIPAIDAPRFDSVARAAESLSPTEPLISLEVGDDARAYPLRILVWHEIVNDTVGGQPVAVTFCPLCNSAVVFDRRVEGRVLTFGVSGKLRNSDLVMYDRQTESWWQQFSGDGLLGAMAGKRLAILPMRVESIERFRQRHPQGRVLAPPGDTRRPYGTNPYVSYDSSERPFLFDGALPEGVPPLERVLVVGDQAWTFSLLREKKRITVGDLVITWESGQSSALDAASIADGRDVGNVVVQRRAANGDLVDAVHDVSFAFAFFAFHPTGTIHSPAKP